jgi:hypothetical protein
MRDLIKQAKGAENGRFQPPCSHSTGLDDPKILEDCGTGFGGFLTSMNPELVIAFVASRHRRVGRKLNPSYQMREVSF